jgi:hypothetical protein
MFKVEIKTITGIKAVALNHSGSYQSIGRTLRCCAAC